MNIHVTHNSEGLILAFGTSPVSIDGCTTSEFFVNHNHPLLQESNMTLYRVVAGELVEAPQESLTSAKAYKLEEVRQRCQDVIIAGFDHVIDGITYHFSLDTEAQQNFTSTYQLMRDGLVNEVPWTVTVDGEYTRIVITKDIMEELAVAILNHKTSNIAKFRDVLSILIEGAQTLEEVTAIQW